MDDGYIHVTDVEAVAKAMLAASGPRRTRAQVGSPR
jgi:hypothetical protein